MISALDHGEAQQRFSELVDGDLAPDVRAAVEGHVEDCDACKDALERFRQTVAGLRSLSAPPPAEDILARVQQKIRKRSRGRYFDRGFAVSGMRFPYELVALLMLLTLLVVYFGMTTLGEIRPVSRTTAGEREEPPERR
jgi:anti-sigma factor RsiW